MKVINKILPVLLSAGVLFSCGEDYLETQPTDAVSGDLVFESAEGAVVALNGTLRYMYSSGDTHGQFGPKSTDLTFDLMGEDMLLYTRGYGWFTSEYAMTAIETPDNGTRSDYTWEQNYVIANNATRILVNIGDADGDQELKDYVAGQAYALRAFAYYQLALAFQQNVTVDPSAPGVPIYREPTNEGNPRSTMAEVYAFIHENLDESIKLLEEKTRQHISHVDVNVIKGLKARVALQEHDYATAAKNAKEAREGYALMSAGDYGAGFGRVNDEWIWGLQVIDDQATIFASFFSHMDPTILSYAQLGLQKLVFTPLYEHMGDSDVRKSIVVTPGEGEGDTPDYCSLKFRVPNPGLWDADYLLMRAAEMYLIEAEAEARLGNDGSALTVLNELVSARDADYAFTGNGEALIDEILMQRRIELWGEGFRLPDIKRLDIGVDRRGGNHEPSLANLMQVEARSPRFAMRIPQREIDANDALTAADQNPSVPVQ